LSRLKRQKLREAKAIDGILASMPAYKHREVVTPERLAPARRHIETIVAAEHVDKDTGEVSVIERTRRVIALVDQMHRDGLLSMELHRAAERYRELHFEAQGGSSGVSSYGEYAQATEASQRLPMSQHQLQASRDFDAAIEAAVGVRRADGRMAKDEHLLELFNKAVLDDGKDVTQSWLGEQRTPYQGRSQQSTAGGMVVHEILQRLSLHFAFRER
jgi:hypothetical protein